MTDIIRLIALAYFLFCSSFSAMASDGSGVALGDQYSTNGTGASAGSIGCNSANIFGAALIDGICWKRMLPIRFMGLGGGSDAPSDPPEFPVCACTDGLGVPRFGVPVGMWSPFRLAEIVRNPYCSPILGGHFLTRNSIRFAGTHAKHEYDTHAGYWHSHLLSFPLLWMLQLVTSTNCNADTYSDIDFIMLSELDPTVTDPELSLLVYAETVLFANPLALMGCAADCAAVSVDAVGGQKKPVPGVAFWCQGCWGSLYPLTNTGPTDVSSSQIGLTIATKQLALKHRRGLGRKTYGSSNMCGGVIYPFLPKEQYQWSQMFPYHEASGRCSHWIGESTLTNGLESRTIPTVGEDKLFMLWRYVDCCTIANP